MGEVLARQILKDLQMKNVKKYFLTGAMALSLLILPAACNNRKAEVNVIESYTTAQQIKTLQQLEDIVKNNEKVVACISAKWCLPCQGYEPIFEETAKDYGKDVVFCKFTTSDGWEKGEFKKIRDKYNFYGVPKTMLFKNGKEVHRLYSADKERLKGLVDHYLLGKEKPKEMFEGLAEGLVEFCDDVADTSFHIAVAVATDIDNDGKEDLQGYEQLLEKMKMEFEKGKPIEHYKRIMKERIMNTPWKEEQRYVTDEKGKIVLETSKRKCIDVYDACWSMFSETDKETYRRILGQVENLIEAKELKEKSLHGKAEK